MKSNNIELIINVNVFGKLINHQINKIKDGKKKYLEKYKKTKQKNSSIDFVGTSTGEQIKIITYLEPFDKPIMINFLPNSDMYEIFYELNIHEPFDIVNLDKNEDLDRLIKKINEYIGIVQDNTSNIYDTFNFTIVNNEHDPDPEEIIFNNYNKKQIIIWNLILKKYYCLIWMFIEKIYLQYKTYKINQESIKTDDKILFELNNEYKNNQKINLKEIFEKFQSQINDLVLVMIWIKKIFDYLDENNKILSFDMIDIIIDKLTFVVNYICKNFIITNNYNIQ